MKILVLFVLVKLISIPLFSQEPNPKAKRLKESYNKEQSRLVSTEALIFFADSLIIVGESVINDATNDLLLLAKEKRNTDKEFFKEYRGIKRQLKSKDKEFLKQGKIKAKAIENEYKLLMRDWNLRQKEAIKNLKDGQKEITKGKNSLKKAKAKNKASKKKVKKIENQLQKIK